MPCVRSDKRKWKIWKNTFRLLVRKWKVGFFCGGTFSSRTYYFFIFLGHLSKLFSCSINIRWIYLCWAEQVWLQYLCAQKAFPPFVLAFIMQNQYRVYIVTMKLNCLTANTSRKITWKLLQAAALCPIKPLHSGALIFFLIESKKNRSGPNSFISSFWTGPDRFTNKTGLVTFWLLFNLLSELRGPLRGIKKKIGER